jgi:hypothetical protein
MPNIQRVRVVFVGVAGSPYYSNFYVTATDSDAQPEVDEIRDFYTDIAGLISNTLSWTVEGVVANIDEASGQITGFSNNTSRTGAGTNSGDINPLANQGLLRLRTGVFTAGREIRGRLNIPGSCEASNTAGKPTSTYMTTLQTSADLHLLSATGLNGAYNVYSRKNGSTEIVSSVSVAPYWAVLRSRRD